MSAPRAAFRCTMFFRCRFSRTVPSRREDRVTHAPVLLPVQKEMDSVKVPGYRSGGSMPVTSKSTPVTCSRT